MGKGKYITVDNDDFIIESFSEGKLDREILDSISFLIAQSYKNKR